MGVKRLAREIVVHKPCDLLLLVCVCVYTYILYTFIYMYIIPLFASSVLQFGC